MLIALPVQGATVGLEAPQLDTASTQVTWTSTPVGTCEPEVLPLSGNGYALRSSDFGTNYLSTQIDGRKARQLSAEFRFSEAVNVPYRGTSPGLRLKFGNDELIVAFSPDGQRIQHAGALGQNYGGPGFVPGQWYKVAITWQNDGLELQYFNETGMALNSPQKLAFKDAEQAARWMGQGEVRLGAFNHLASCNAGETTVQVRNYKLEGLEPVPAAEEINEIAYAHPDLVGVDGMVHEFIDFGKQLSRTTFDAADGVIGLYNPAYATSFFEVPVDGSAVKSFSAEFRLSHPVTLNSRTQGPGLLARFGSRYIWVRFTGDGQRIQWGGTDGSHFGGVPFKPGVWYRINLSFYGDRIEIGYTDANGQALCNPFVMPYRQGTGIEDWRGQGVIQVGNFNSAATTGDGLTRVEVRKIQRENGTKVTFGTNWKSRHIFARDEQAQTLKLSYDNLSLSRRSGQMTAMLDGVQLGKQAFDAAALSTTQVELPFEPADFKPGEYELELVMQLNDGATETLKLPLTVAPSRHITQLPYETWNRFEVDQLDLTASWGFNQNKMWSSTLSLPTTEQLDLHLAKGFMHGGHLGSTTGLFKEEVAQLRTHEQFQTLGVNGQELDRINPFSQTYHDVIVNYVLDQLGNVGDHQAFNNLLVNTEKKEGPLAYNPEALADARARGYLKANENFPAGFTTSDVPELDLNHPSVEKPAKGLISANNLHYRTWLWWKRHGGYQPIHKALGEAIDQHFPEVEMTVEFAPEGADWLEFWYRTGGGGENDPVFYNGHMADMRYSARKYGHKNSALFQFVASEEPLSRAIFRESFWTVFSNRPDRMGHWGTDRALDPSNSPERQAAFNEQIAEMERMQETLAKPLFPAIANTERPYAKVGFINSEAAWLYRGGRASEYMHDWRSQGLLKYRERALALANIPWEPVHDSDVREGALEDFDAVFVLATEVLPDDVFAKLKTFAQNGGTIFMDKKARDTFPTLPNTQVVDPDFFVIDNQSRWWPTQHDARIISDYYKAAQVLRSAFFKAGFRPDAWVDTTSAVVNELRDGDARYVFVVNDLRTDTSAQADGIAQTTNLHLKVNGSVKVYDLLQRKTLSHTTNKDGTITIKNLQLGKADGRALLVVPYTLDIPSLAAPFITARGDQNTIQVLCNGKGSVPVEVKIVTSDLQELDGSGYYAVQDGKLAIPFTVPANTNDRVVQIMVRYVHSESWNRRILYLR
ncbi:MAG: hypothetical protein Q7P63_02150 [Verrucomicrobiota bacterium JB022]|nr:hypothetical protein [Verrucomicrobiota bacterium JB022]